MFFQAVLNWWTSRCVFKPTGESGICDYNNLKTLEPELADDLVGTDECGSGPYQLLEERIQTDDHQLVSYLTDAARNGWLLDMQQIVTGSYGSSF